MANNIIINQALDALRASLPVGDVVSTTAVKVNCTNENDVTVKIMNVDFVCHVRENITKATLNPTLATMQTMNNDKQQILLVTQYVATGINRIGKQRHQLSGLCRKLPCQIYKGRKLDFPNI